MLGVLGKYIDSSGGPHLLTKSQVIASGSLSFVLRGKAYKRGRRCHSLLVTCMEIGHFEEFLNQNDKDLSTLTMDLTSIQAINQLTADMQTLLDAYKKFSQDTDEGKHGLTAQYCMDT